MPLERTCVRFIDNFSGGSRGALSTEYFLEAGYAVIFLNRKGTIQPFTKGLPSSQLFDCLTEVIEVGGNGVGSIPHVKAEAEAVVSEAVQRVNRVNEQGLLLRVPYTTLFEYIMFLRLIASCLQLCGRSAIFYLAAAVSDFFLPWSQMVEHKIQSADGPLHLDLHKVPKMLGLLHKEWAPDAFIVSFKLETDERLLTSKACSSIESYGVHAVVANLLQTRKEQVWIVQKHGEVIAVQSIERDKSEPFIEKQLICHIVGLHQHAMTGNSHSIQ
ncbi:hypothetical protein WJX72_011926 [[Myrmecia] bisecta]|uniref:DNA/pantothenate metabolism flavoprotein C-terminal domain-containing protein n=1 Tax=[Myrmecia] bisecta TaxID=41462 RepID=A0AAW1RAY4_9CHLO